MLIHIITHLSYESLNPAKAFGRKKSKCDLAEKMEDKFKIVEKLCEYLITSITDLVVKVSTYILASKVMRKCRADEVPTPVVSLAAQCIEGIQFN